MDSLSIVVKNEVADEWMSEHHFTDSARRFINDADARSGDRGMFGEIPPLLLLWTMLRWERKIGVVVLERCGIDLAVLERDVESELESAWDSDWRHGIDLIHLMSVAKQAANEAAALGHNYVGDEYFVLALCRDTDEAVKRVFQKHNISAERYTPILKDALVAIQGTSQF